MAGFAVGFALTKQWQLHVLHTQAKAPTLYAKLANFCRRIPATHTPWHLISLRTENIHFLTIIGIA
ncbi:hypothetical protein CCR75_008810 [Bremia lactucae]|uniref:Uncharacterized protein n=1 Tax=Bremia lactucae TaxID=4779 RepID=A0A976FH10_BRELC|nr:hypothetical protein CCR75_008810 [Bremia lactucae]